jgi:hypothetical protein
MLDTMQQELENVYSNGIYFQILPYCIQSRFKATVGPGQSSLPFISFKPG